MSLFCGVFQKLSSKNIGSNCSDSLSIRSTVFLNSYSRAKLSSKIIGQKSKLSIFSIIVPRWQAISLIVSMWFYFCLLFWLNFYNFVVQLLGETLFVVVGLHGRNIDCRECWAFVESIRVNLCYRLGNCDTLKRGAILKSAPPNHGYSFGNDGYAILNLKLISIVLYSKYSWTASYTRMSASVSSQFSRSQSKEGLR